MEPATWGEQARFWAGEYRRRLITWSVAKASPETALQVQQELERQAPPVTFGVVFDWRNPLFAAMVRQIDVVADHTVLTVPVDQPLPGTDGHVWPTVHVHRLAEVTVDPRTGLAFVDGRILDASEYGGRPARVTAMLSGAGLRLTKRSASVRIRGPIAPIAPIVNYFHFVTDTVPRMCAIRRTHADVTFAVEGSVPRYAQQLLAMLDLPYRLYPSGEPVLIDEVILCDAWPMEWPHPVLVRQARDALLDAAQDDRPEPPSGEPAPAPRWLYVSRVGSWRSPDGEEQLEADLTALGVMVVRWQDMSVAEQIRTVRAADCLIGTHGAGLTNLMFMRPGTEVIEFTTGDWWSPCFRNLAAASDVRHRLVTLPHGADEPFGRAGDVLAEVRRLAAGWADDERPTPDGDRRDGRGLDGPA